MATFYIDTTSFETASAVYTTADLSTKAADGFYSDGGIYREQSSGILLDPTDCPSCQVACGTLVSVTSVDEGVYDISFNAGASTGAIGIEFDPSSTPKGIRVEYDGTIYTTVVANGVAKGGNQRTFVGLSDNDCGIANNSRILPIFKYKASSFISTNNTDSFSVQQSALNLSSTAPGTTTLVVPKPNASPTEVKIRIYVVCPSDKDFDIKAVCPVTLTGFNADDTITSSASGACALGGSYGSTFYNYPINGTAGVPAVGDFVFTDANGVNPVPAGFYNYSNSGTDSSMEVDSNGVVVSIESCVSTVFVQSALNGLGTLSATITVTST